jgi:hypothetical protein
MTLLDDFSLRVDAISQYFELVQPLSFTSHLFTLSNQRLTMLPSRHRNDATTSLQGYPKTPRRFESRNFFYSGYQHICRSFTWLFQNDLIPIHQRLEFARHHSRFGHVLPAIAFIPSPSSLALMRITLPCFSTWCAYPVESLACGMSVRELSDHSVYT